MFSIRGTRCAGKRRFFVVIVALLFIFFCAEMSNILDFEYNFRAEFYVCCYRAKGKNVSSAWMDTGTNATQRCLQIYWISSFECGNWKVNISQQNVWYTIFFFLKSLTVIKLDTVTGLVPHNKSSNAIYDALIFVCEKKSWEINQFTSFDKRVLRRMRRMTQPTNAGSKALSTREKWFTWMKKCLDCARTSGWDHLMAMVMKLAFRSANCGSFE